MTSDDCRQVSTVALLFPVRLCCRQRDHCFQRRRGRKTHRVRRCGHGLTVRRAHLLTRKFNSTLTVANIRRETLLSATRVDPLPASRPYRPPHDRFYILWSQAYILQRAPIQPTQFGALLLCLPTARGATRQEPAPNHRLRKESRHVRLPRFADRACASWRLRPRIVHVSCERIGRKKALISAASCCGASSAAKWPPDGIGVHRVILP